MICARGECCVWPGSPPCARHSRSGGTRAGASAAGPRVAARASETATRDTTGRDGVGWVMGPSIEARPAARQRPGQERYASMTARWSARAPRTALTGIERSKVASRPLSLDRQAQQVDIGEMPVPDRQAEDAGVAQGDVIGPEHVVAALPERREAPRDLRGPLGGRGVGGVRQDAHDPVLRQRTRRPTRGAVGAEPDVGRLVMDVVRIEQRDEEVDVEEGWTAHVSSRSRLTRSIVGLGLPRCRRARSRTPFRTADDPWARAPGARDRRAPCRSSFAGSRPAPWRPAARRRRCRASSSSVDHHPSRIRCQRTRSDVRGDGRAREHPVESRATAAVRRRTPRPP